MNAFPSRSAKSVYGREVHWEKAITPRSNMINECTTAVVEPPSSGVLGEHGAVLVRSTNKMTLVSNRGQDAST